ncbi:MAG: hypothetical protein WC091_20270 [Sulfuricellaceae bacterium]
MATITGLQSPNPYAQAANETSVWARAALSTVDMDTHAVSSHSSYSPDWMQEDYAAAEPGTTAGLYGAKGELVKLSLVTLPANDQ